MAEFHAPYRIELGLFGRFIIVNARDSGLAWSGSCWVEHENGVPTGRSQVSSYATEEEARQVALDVWSI